MYLHGLGMFFLEVWDALLTLYSTGYHTAGHEPKLFGPAHSPFSLSLSVQATLFLSPARPTDEFKARIFTTPAVTNQNVNCTYL